MHPVMGLGTVKLEQESGQIEGEITLEVEQDVKQLILRVTQPGFTPPTDGPLTTSLLQGLLVDLTECGQQSVKRFLIQPGE